MWVCVTRVWRFCSCGVRKDQADRGLRCPLLGISAHCRLRADYIAIHFYVSLLSADPSQPSLIPWLGSFVFYIMRPPCTSLPGMYSTYCSYKAWACQSHTSPEADCHCHRHISKCGPAVCLWEIQSTRCTHCLMSKKLPCLRVMSYVHWNALLKQIFSPCLKQKP